MDRQLFGEKYSNIDGERTAGWVRQMIETQIVSAAVYAIEATVATYQRIMDLKESLFAVRLSSLLALLGS